MPTVAAGESANRVAGQVRRLERVGEWNPDGAPPREVEAEAIVMHVDRPEVPVLAREEVQHVDELQQVHEDHRARDVPEFLELLRGKGGVHGGPRHHPDAPDVEELEVERPDARVQLDAHEEVGDGVAAPSTVDGMARESARLPVGEHRHQESGGVGGDQEPAAVVRDDRRRKQPPPEHGEAEQDVRDEPRQEPVEPVGRPMAGRGGPAVTRPGSAIASTAWDAYHAAKTVKPASVGRGAAASMSAVALQPSRAIPIRGPDSAQSYARQLVQACATMNGAPTSSAARASADPTVGMVSLSLASRA